MSTGLDLREKQCKKLGFTPVKYDTLMHAELECLLRLRWLTPATGFQLGDTLMYRPSDRALRVLRPGTPYYDLLTPPPYVHHDVMFQYAEIGGTHLVRAYFPHLVFESRQSVVSTRSQRVSMAIYDYPHAASHSKMVVMTPIGESDQGYELDVDFATPTQCARLIIRLANSLYYPIASYWDSEGRHELSIDTGAMEVIS